jgi:hypothetical protein
LDGDRALLFHSNNVISDLFGQDNRSLRSRISGDWVSNGNWTILALLYRLDRLVGWWPKTSHHFHKEGNLGAKKNTKATLEADKYFADLWEAFWCAVLTERELWNQDQHPIEDLRKVTRDLMYRRYRPIIDSYSTNFVVPKDTTTSPAIISTTSRQISAPQIVATVKDVTLKVITTKDDKIHESLGQVREEVLGYVATIFDTTGPTTTSTTHNTSPRPASISIYAATPEEATSKALQWTNMGVKRSPRSPTILTFLALRPGLPPQSTSQNKTSKDNPANNLRQKVFDIMIEHWLSPTADIGYRKMLPLPKEDVLPVYTRIKTLGREFLNLPSGFPLKEFAMLFWYEVHPPHIFHVDNPRNPQ